MVSSPHYPQSNSHAEAAVKTVMHLILKVAPSGNTACKDFNYRLLELHNASNYTISSLTQVLYGHPLCSRVPAQSRSFLKEWQTKTELCDCGATKQVVTYYNMNACPLPRLKINEQICIHDSTSFHWDKVGPVMGIRSHNY